MPNANKLIHVSRDKLDDLYTKRMMSTREIANLLGVSRSGVLWRLKYWSIPIRGFWHPLVVKQRTAKIINFSGLKRENSPKWKGGKYRDKKGYIMVLSPNHNGSKRRYIGEHILVWEEANKKLLPKGWIVHHLNGIKDDNRIENLKGMPTTEHPKIIKIFQERIRELELQLKKEEEKWQMNS